MKLSSTLLLTFALCLSAFADEPAGNFRNAYGPHFRGAQPINPNRAPNLSRHSLGLDKTQGIAQGRKVGNYVFDHAFTPLPRK